MNNTVVWYRNDLRVHDHAPLTAAINQAKLSHGEVHAVYIYAEPQLRHHGTGDTRLAAIKYALTALQLSLNALGIGLTIIQADNWQQGIRQLLAYCQRHNIGSLYHHHEPGWDEQTRDQQLRAEANASLSIHRHLDLCLLPPQSLVTGKGQPYQVFGAYRKALLQRLTSEVSSPLPIPVTTDQPRPTPQKVSINHLHWLNPLQLPVTEAEAHARLEQFLPRMHRYAGERDHPALASTSGLSVALSLGSISSRQLLHEIINAGFSLENNSWFDEIIWRDFYQYLLFHRPELCLGKAFKPARDSFPWRTDSIQLQRWQQGKTGVPIVDAAMRQLNNTGWMHNRLRMISAMYLVKILQIDWRLGETWFANKLADFNFAANNGGWQWVASTGADAVPYFRIFNPTLQSKKFDPDGTFIRTYISELRNVPGKRIHQPTASERSKYNYPEECVDYASARADTLEQFARLKSETLVGATGYA